VVALLAVFLTTLLPAESHQFRALVAPVLLFAISHPHSLV